jgi:serine phosphatase RsbU (regulator of sigma subunit)
MNAKEEEFAEERLIQVVSRNGYLDACQLRDSILSEVDNFAGKTLQHDDETLVIARVL